jgi:phage-related protein
MISFVDGIAAGIAAHKGPLSFDKVVLRPAGLALMDGLLGGIRDGNDDVQRFVSGIAAQLADPFAANLTGSALTVSTLPTPASTLAATAQSQAMDRLISAIGNQAVKVDVMLDGQPFAAMVTTAVVEQDRESARIVKAGGGTSW